MATPTPNLPDVWLVRIDGDLNGEQCANVIALREIGAPVTAEECADAVADSLLAVLVSGAGTTYRNLIDNGKAWTGCHVVRYAASDPDTFDRSFVDAEFTGASGSPSLAPQLAICVSLRTGVASRRARGRFFDYGFTEGSATNDGRIEAATSAAVEAFWEAFRVEISTGHDLGWAVLSRGWINEGASDPRETYAQQARYITSLLVRDNLFDTMRSRVPDS